MKTRVALILAFAWVACTGRGDACSSTSCSLATRGPDSGLLAQGKWRLDLIYRDIDQSLRRYGHEPIAVYGAAEPPVLRPRLDFDTGALVNNYHQEFGSWGRYAQFDVGYGLTRRLTLVGSLGVWNERRVDHVVHPPRNSATHEEKIELSSRAVLRTVGMGDAQLSARYQVAGPLVLGLGVVLPTGDYDRRDEYGQIADPMSQPGSGSVGLVATAAVAGRIPSWNAAWAAYGSHQLSRGNPLGYRLGGDTIGVAGLSRPVVKRVSAVLQGKVQHLARSRFAGVESPSSGATVVSIIPGASLAGPAGLAFSATLQLPVYQHVNEGQLAVRSVLTLGLSLAR